MSKVTTIALTGGPCGGKSTSISVIEQELTNKGYQVFVVEEMATNVILSGANPGLITNYEFQKMLIKLQHERNKVYDKMAENFSERTGKPVVILYDRGIPDAKGFMPRKEYSSLVKELGLNEVDIMDYYDGVFHLVTAADGAREAYTCENNSARTETPEQAIERDKGCMDAWTGHPHLRVIRNGCTFEKKISNLLEEVYTLLGVPYPLEIERKYLISKEGLEDAIKDFKKTTVDIIQTYLTSNESEAERRVRQRGIDGNYTFYYTEKQKVSDVSRVEIEKKISKEEYLEYLMEADTTLHQIRKQRTCFVYEGTYFELDQYPFWKDKVIVEVELSDENKKVEFPKGLVVLKEVTDDDRYRNASLARSLGQFEINSCQSPNL